MSQTLSRVSSVQVLAASLAGITEEAVIDNFNTSIITRVVEVDGVVKVSVLTALRNGVKELLVDDFTTATRYPVTITDHIGEVTLIVQSPVIYSFD